MRARRMRFGWVAVVIVVAGVCGGSAPALARDAVVTSFDGTPIVASFFPAEGLGPGEKAPTVLETHGWGLVRDSSGDGASSDDFGLIGTGALRRAGYNVLTWDSRGFGQSGGTVQVDSPAFEGRDVQTLLDYVAQQPEAQLDGANDPRVGMTGPSYAGGIELVAAGLDQRIDAIAPAIAWHSLTTSLDKDGAVKTGWASALYGLGLPTSLALGLLSPAGLQTGALDSHVTQAFVEGLVTGSISEPTREWFASRGPGDELVGRIKAPTLLIQGTADTLFTPQEAITNAEQLMANGVPTKMIWFCGGHGICTTSKGEGGRLEKAAVDWFARYLKADKSRDTGPGFEWVADDGTWRSTRAWPPPHAEPIAAEGSGTLAITPGIGAGLLIAATPAPNNVAVALPATKEPADVVGAPTLTLTYSGTATSRTTHLFAQLVDTAARRVAGNQVTPIPVVLDGKEHMIERPLEPIALHATPASRYALQLTDQTNLYAPQRALGSVRVKARIELPVVGPEPPAARAVGKVVRLVVTGSRKRLRGARRLRIKLRPYEPLRRVEITLRTTKGVLLGSARARALRKPGLLTLRLRNPLERGRYLLAAIYTTAAGERGQVLRTVRLG